MRGLQKGGVFKYGCALCSLVSPGSSCSWCVCVVCVSCVHVYICVRVFFHHLISEFLESPSLVVQRLSVCAPGCMCCLRSRCKDTHFNRKHEDTLRLLPVVSLSSNRFLGTTPMCPFPWRLLFPESMFQLSRRSNVQFLSPLRLLLLQYNRSPKHGSVVVDIFLAHAPFQPHAIH